MTYKSFFDLRMLSLFVTMALLGIIMTRLSPPGTLDGRLFYWNIEANTFLQSLSGDGIYTYRMVEFLDVFFIYKYTRTFMLALTRLFPETKWQWLGVIPGAFDLFETGNIIAALHMNQPMIYFPNLGVITFIKWATALILILFIFFNLFKKAAFKATKI